MSENLKVLIVVSGGVADFSCDPGVEVCLFDLDNFRDDPVGTEGVPESFRNLAECWHSIPIGVSLEERFPIQDWQAEVASGDTVRGYREWAKAQAEESSHAA